MAKITGLRELTRELEQAQKAFAGLDGKLGSVSYDPYDPASIEQAIQKINAMVDEKVGQYASNRLVAPMIAASKERFRSAIIERAANARMKGDADDGQE